MTCAAQPVLDWWAAQEDKTILVLPDNWEKFYRAWEKSQPKSAKIAIQTCGEFEREIAKLNKKIDSLQKENSYLKWEEERQLRFARSDLGRRSIELEQERAVFNSRFGRAENFEEREARVLALEEAQDNEAAQRAAEAIVDGRFSVMEQMSR